MASKRVRIAIVAGTTIGGTEKAATMFAAELANRGYEVDFLGLPGPRAAFLAQHKVEHYHVGNDEAALAEYLTNRRPDILHQHVPGLPTENPIYKVWDSLGERRPRLIETNHFGWFEDPESQRLVSYRMFVSKACCVKAFMRSGRKITPEDLVNQGVVYNPIEDPPPLDPAERRQFRQNLGVADDEILAVRIGRAGWKWRTWECKAFVRAKKKTGALRLLVMEPPAPIFRAIESGRYGNGIIARRETADFEWLGKLYRSADLMIHGSSIGESYGYTIAEAMAAGLPVIVRTTPWIDNAQVELVQNGQTGFVCASVGEMARRFVDLARDPDLRAQMGRAGRNRIQQLAGLSHEADALEAVINKVLTGQESPLLQQRARELLEFARTYRKLEWTISESPWSHPVDFLGALVYGMYWTLRYAEWKRRMRLKRAIAYARRRRIRK